MTDQQSPEALKLLHLGDSYTCAEGIDPANGWPALLAEFIRATGRTVGKQRIIARTGWTSGELLEALEEQDPGEGWNLVTLCIGVNNQYRGLSVDTFRDELGQLIRRGREASGDLWPGLHLLSIPDWGVSLFAEGRDRRRIADEIDAFNQCLLSCGRDSELPVHDLAALSRKLGARTGAFASDGLHPSEIQHRIWAEYIFRGIFSAE